jgi:ABC-type transport system involved in multi-copper enzyme maturation permease subunit
MLTRRVGAAAFVITVVVGLTALGVWMGRSNPSSPLQRLLGYAVAAFLFGIMVGLSEILSRYRDEPLLAASTNFGLAYLALNGVISLTAYAVMQRYSQQIFPAIKDDLFLTAVVSGFGAMAVFRSKLFTFRSTDGKDYPIGPSIVLDTVLKTIDSKIDRRRATERQAEVFASISGLKFVPVANYMEASLSAFQNLSQDDKTEIKSVIDQYRTLPDWPDTLKCLGLGFAFLTLAGDENYEQVIANLKSYIAAQDATNAAQAVAAVVSVPDGQTPPAAGGQPPPPAGGQPPPPAGGEEG